MYGTLINAVVVDIPTLEPQEERMILLAETVSNWGHERGQDIVDTDVHTAQKLSTTERFTYRYQSLSSKEAKFSRVT